MAGAFIDFDIVALIDEDLARVAITGDLDTNSAPRLIALMHEIAVPPLRAIELDCGGVTFLDSAGVRAFIVVRNEAALNGVDMQLVHPSAPVARVIQMTGLVGFLTDTRSS
jgi:anti-anti-sigma factor